MPRITVQDQGRSFEVDDNANLRDALVQNGASPYGGVEKLFNCRGKGMCGTCVVLIVEGAEHLTERTPREINKLQTADRCRRLSCQAAIIGDEHIVLNTLT